MSDQPKHIAAVGKLRTVEYAVRDDETMPAREYIDGLPKNVKERFLALFGHMAQNGEGRLTDVMFCRERGEIYTFKGKDNKIRLRLPCFKLGNRWIITHGFPKPGKSKWPEEQFKLANEIREEVLVRERKASCNTKGR